MAEDRVTVQEAARRLGVKEDAIRKRIRRGTLRSEKGAGGRVYVWLDSTQAEEEPAEAGTQDAGRVELVEVLRDEVAHLRTQLDAEREANRENRRLLAAALERVPAISSPDEQNPANSGQEPRPEGSSTTPEPGEANIGRPWWRRIFGG